MIQIYTQDENELKKVMLVPDSGLTEDYIYNSEMRYVRQYEVADVVDEQIMRSEFGEMIEAAYELAGEAKDAADIATEVSETAKSDAETARQQAELAVTTAVDAKQAVDNKQNKLTPGEGITIENDVISSTGGVSSVNGMTGDVVLDIPTKTSQLTNDSGYVTSNETVDINTYNQFVENQHVIDESQNVVISDLQTEVNEKASTGYVDEQIQDLGDEIDGKLANKQDQLVSGTNISTINGLNLLNGGNIVVGNPEGGEYIMFADGYLEDANEWNTDGYIQTTSSTANLPSIGLGKWGVLLTIMQHYEGATTGTQMFYPAQGDYAGRVYIRPYAGTSTSALAWQLIPSMEDIQPGIPEAPIDGQQYARQNGDWAVVQGVEPEDGKYIVFANDYVLDANDIPADGYARTNGSSRNLPEQCEGMDMWGVLFTIMENSDYRNGTQLYYPGPGGTHAGRVFYRSYVGYGGTTDTWHLIPSMEDIQPGIPDAPSDGKQYARQNGNWAEVQAGDVTAAGNNVFTGENEFTKYTEFDKAVAFPASTSIQSNGTIYEQGEPLSNKYALKSEITPTTPNVVKFGDLSIENGVMSGFSASNYAQFPFLMDLTDKAFEITMEITTSNIISSQQNILDSRDGLAFAIRDGQLVLAVSSNGTTWAFEATGGDIQPNTTYLIKLAWNRLVYTVKYSTDNGATWNDAISQAYSGHPYPRTMLIGKDTTGNYVFLGQINLNKCTLSVNNQFVWDGMTDAGLLTRLETDLGNIDKAGEQKIKEIAGTNNTIILTATLEDETTVSYKIYGEQI